MYSVDPGFDRPGVLTARMSLQGERYSDPARLRMFYDEGLERIRRLPGVRSAAVVNGVPIERALNLNVDVLDGPEKIEDALTDWRYASPDYFDTLRIRVVAGRGITDADRAGAPPVVVVSEEFARRFFKGSTALGRHVRVFDADGSMEIVGIVKDLKEGGLKGRADSGDVCPDGSGARRRDPNHAQLFSGELGRPRRRSGSCPGSPDRGIDPHARSAAAVLVLPNDGPGEEPGGRNRTLPDDAAHDVRRHRTPAGRCGCLRTRWRTPSRNGHASSAFASRSAPRAPVFSGPSSGAAPHSRSSGSRLGTLAALAATKTLQGFVWNVSPSAPVTFVAVGVVLLVAGAASLSPRSAPSGSNPMTALRE